MLLRCVLLIETNINNNPLICLVIMKQTFRIVVALLLLMGLHSASMLARTNGERQTSSYSFHNFTALSVSGVAHVFFTQADNYSITVEESDNPDLETIVEESGHTLVVKTKNKKDRMGNASSPVIRITAPKLTGIKTSGATKLSVERLETSDLSLDFSGVAKARFMDVICQTLSIGASGSAHVSTGKVNCTSLKVGASGACKMKMQVEAKGNGRMTFSGASQSDIDFKGDRLELASSGAGKHNLHVDCKSLVATNSGAGKVNISGTADETKIDASGVAKINTSGLNQY